MVHSIRTFASEMRVPIVDFDWYKSLVVSEIRTLAHGVPQVFTKSEMEMCRERCSRMDRNTGPSLPSLHKEIPCIANTKERVLYTSYIL